MKLKRLAALLCAAVLLCAGGAVFAAEPGVVTEASVTLEAPAGNALPEDLTAAKVDRFVYVKTHVTVDENEVEQTETETVTLENLSAAVSWTQGGAAVEGPFIAGKTYRAEITFSVEGIADLSVSPEAAVTVNGAKATLKKETSGETEVFRVTADLQAAAGDLKPRVSIKTYGDEIRLEREYSGKSTELRVQIGNTATLPEGAVFRYQWYRLTGENEVKKEEPVEGAVTESLTVKNVADSGEYTCHVKTVWQDTESEEAVAEPVKVAITRLKVRLILDNVEINVGDPDPKLFTFTLQPDVEDDIIGSAERTKGDRVGEYAITGGTLAFGEDVRDNYELEIQNGTLFILGKESTAFAPTGSTADESRIRGKSGSKIKIDASANSVPEGAHFHLGAADDASNAAFAAKDEVLKSFSLSLFTEESVEISLRKDGRIKVKIPLTEEEEAFINTGYAAQADPKTGAVSDQESSVEMIGDVWYVSFETDKLLPTALLKGKTSLREIDLSGNSNAPDPTVPQGPGGPPVGPWIWAIVIIPAVLAVAAILFSVIWTRRQNAAQKNRPVKKVAPPRPAAPGPAKRPAAPAKPNGPRPAQPQAEPPRKKRTVSFDDLDD